MMKNKRNIFFFWKKKLSHNLYDILLIFQIASFSNYVHINSDAILED